MIASRRVNPILHQTTPEIFGDTKMQDMDNLSEMEEDYKIFRRKNAIKGEQELYY
jgi:hypothetical protein